MKRVLAVVALVLPLHPLHTVPADAAAPDPVLTAMRRDLGLTADQARARLAAVVPAAQTSASLRSRLGDRFGGAWLDGTRLVVGVTEASQAAKVRAAGALPVLVRRGVRELDAVKATLDRHASAAPDTISGWHVDPVTNSVVVLTDPTALDTARAFVAGTGADSGPVRLVPVTARLLPMNPPYEYIRGGDAVYPPAGRCSVGFSVHGGYLTAGHCINVGETVQGYNHQGNGIAAGSSFPVNDYGWVDVNNNVWIPRGEVRNGGTVAVQGSIEAPVGSPVCRSGSTTGWRCGTILATGQTVNYPQGTVFGLTETSACGDFGDSGGSFLSGGQAQGVLSGGAGNCTNGGTTGFQPVNEILATYGLQLVTTASPLVIHDVWCEVDGPPVYPPSDLPLRGLPPRWRRTVHVLVVPQRRHPVPGFELDLRSLSRVRLRHRRRGPRLRRQPHQHEHRLRLPRLTPPTKTPPSRLSPMPRSVDENRAMRERSVERILDAALTLFAERGYQGATISQITQRAGVSRGLVSYYFPSKRALLDAILSRLMTWILQLVRGVPRTGTARQRLAYLVDTTLRSVRENPELHRMEMGLHLQPATVDLVREFEVTHAEEFDEYRRTLRELFAESADPDREQLYFRTVMEGIVFKYCVYGEAYAILDMRRQLYRTFGLGEPGPLD